MRNRRIGALATVVVAACAWCSPGVHAQTSAPPKGSNLPAVQSASRMPDLSGNWTIAPGGTSWDPADPSGSKPEQLPLTPWGLQQLRAAKPPFGANQTFEPNDPVQKYCDPPGAFRMYSYPWQFTIVQTPKQVYVLFEYFHVWRLVQMNQQHPKDVDPTWLGDSVGHYEGDTLVIDTIGFNSKTWLDMVGHPHSEQMHTIERFRRASPDTLALEVTFEDPKAYTHSFTSKRSFKLSAFPLGETMCSLSEDQEFQKSIMDRTVPSAPAK
jgi:hypothetical protein